MRRRRRRYRRCGRRAQGAKLVVLPLSTPIRLIPDTAVQPLEQKEPPLLLEDGLDREDPGADEG